MYADFNRGDLVRQNDVLNFLGFFLTILGSESNNINCHFLNGSLNDIFCLIDSFFQVWFDPGIGYVLPGEVIEFHKQAGVKFLSLYHHRP